MSVSYEIHNIYFESDQLVIGYIELPTDVRVEGKAIQQHQLRLSAEHPDYAEDMTLLHDMAVRALKNALEDFNSTEPYVPALPDEDDDDKGMGE